MRRRGVRHVHTLSAIRAYMKLSVRHKLAWLEEANRLSYRMIKRRAKSIWESFRQGKI